MVSMDNPGFAVSEEEAIASVCITSAYGESYTFQVNLTDIPGTAESKIV